MSEPTTYGPRECDEAIEPSSEADRADDLPLLLTEFQALRAKESELVDRLVLRKNQLCEELAEIEAILQGRLLGKYDTKPSDGRSCAARSRRSNGLFVDRVFSILQTGPSSTGEIVRAFGGRLTKRETATVYVTCSRQYKLGRLNRTRNVEGKFVYSLPALPKESE